MWKTTIVGAAALVLGAAVAVMPDAAEKEAGSALTIKLMSPC